MLLRALGKHPCALPAIIDTPGCVDALVDMLSQDNLAVAAGAADALSLCLVFVEARAVLVQAGASAFWKRFFFCRRVKAV